MRRSLSALTVLLALAGCDRSPRFKGAEADSTAAVPADSNAIYVQMAQQGWSDPDGADEAADLSARVVLQTLRNQPSEPMADRARELIDSLGFGAETAGNRGFVVANFFSRSNPSAGSYPYLFWRDGGATRYQSLDAAGMRLGGAVQEPSDNPAAGVRIAVLFTRLNPNGQQPFAFVWQRPADAASWRLAQSLGPDSLGALGSARFVESSAGGTAMVSRATLPARGFDECAGCPHILRVRNFRWGPAGLVVESEELERSPYYAFVQLIQALTTSNRDEALRWVADPSIADAAIGSGWGTSKGLWRLAPGSSPNARELLMFRGSQEAYRVHFAPQGDSWVVTGFEATNRSIE
jgi:hypothetical protein